MDYETLFAILINSNSKFTFSNIFSFHSFLRFSVKQNNNNEKIFNTM